MQEYMHTASFREEINISSLFFFILCYNVVEMPEAFPYFSHILFLSIVY